MIVALDDPGEFLALPAERLLASVTYSLRRCHTISATLVQISHAPDHHTTPGNRFSTMGTKILGCCR